MSRARFAPLGALAVGVVSLSSLLPVACGTSGYQFIENEDAGVFAKVPDDWTVYDERDLLSASDEEVTELELENVSERLWFRGFDASSDPSLDGVFDVTSTEPRGWVIIEQLSAANREQVNLTQLRGFNPLDTTSQETSSIELMSDEPVEFDGGFHGIHTVFARSEDGEVGVVDQTALLNSTSSAVYVFVVGCNQECYSETHEDQINTIVDSWTIQEDGG